MKNPPIQYEDMLGLGMDPNTQCTSDGISYIIEPQPKSIISKLFNTLLNNPAPEYDRLVYLRHIRDILISLTDWTQTNDSPLNEVQKIAWRNYRQQLRDLPSIYSGDGPIPWPALPN